MRVVLRGSEDVQEFTQVNGVWISDDCEPVHVSFAWERLTAEAPLDDDCVCSPELAARLLRMLFSGSEEHQESSPVPMAPPHLTIVSHVV